MSPTSSEVNKSQKEVKRGEVWRIAFDPTRGSEIRKTRPAVIISSDAIRALPVRLVAPVTGWKAKFKRNLWHVHIEANDRNGLSKASAVDALQVRSVDTSRCLKRLGRVSATKLEDIVTAVAVVIQYR